MCTIKPIQVTKSRIGVVKKEELAPVKSFIDLIVDWKYELDIVTSQILQGMQASMQTTNHPTLWTFIHKLREEENSTSTSYYDNRFNDRRRFNVIIL